MSLEGQRIGRYRLLRLLGSGGMGEVYLAEDTPINRQVAIKVIRAEVTPYPNASAVKEATRLFQREAKAIAMLDHPHILPLYDYGEETINGNTITYLVMPYRPEGSLTLWLQQRSSSGDSQGLSLRAQDVAHLVRQAADALQHAHDRHIIHQDVKPANFLIRTNQENPNRPDLLLADFGVARFSTATTNVSHNIRGTPTYMAPEQLEGNAVAASDQYALAVMTYELLTGRPPFQGALMQVIYQHAQTQPTPPSTFNPGLPPDVDTVILHALAKKPEERFPSISAFSQSFRTALQYTDAPAIVSQDTGRTLNSVDMRATLAISDLEAMRGTTRTLTLPGGRRVNISIPPGAYDGQIIRLEGQGPPSDNGSPGALLIALAITPTAKTPAVSIPDPDSTLSEATILTSPSNSSGRIRVPKPEPQPGPSRVNMILLITLALLVVVGSIGFVFFYVTTNRQLPNVTPTATAPAQGTPQTNTTATPNTTGTGNPYTHTGTLSLNDPLQDNNQGHGWDIGTNANNASCTFTAGIYQVSQPVNGDFHPCFAVATDFSNFVYEVQMTIVSGQAGGIMFRANKANSTFYYFRVGQDGSYDLWTFVDTLIDHAHHLTGGSAPAIHTGYNQPNLVAIVAQGASLALYVNHQLITSVNDNSYSHGQIGVAAYDQGSPAQVVYSNARVWIL